jgi:hypothetical protein
VTDSGAGISQANQTRLFKEFVQFNPDVLQRGGGSGLGLYICKSIMDLHGGSIGVASEGEGLGSTFTVVLPMGRNDLDAIGDTAPRSTRQFPHRSLLHPPRGVAGNRTAQITPRQFMNVAQRQTQRQTQRHTNAQGQGHGLLMTRSSPIEKGMTAAETEGLLAARLSVQLSPQDDDEALSATSECNAGSADDTTSVSPNVPAVPESEVAHDVGTEDDIGDGIGRGQGNANGGIPPCAFVVEDATMQRLLSCLDRGRGLSPRLSPGLSPRGCPSGVDKIEDELPLALDDVTVDVAATVLIVEDATVNRRVMIKLFKSLGQTVEGVGNGQEAVLKVKRRMALQLPLYDAILMDLTMVSELEGFQVTCTVMSCNMTILPLLSLFVVILSH